MNLVQQLFKARPVTHNTHTHTVCNMYTLS